jgi:hypothetical protein
MTKYADLIHLLRDCSDQSTSVLSVLSPILKDKTDILNFYNISYEDQAEGISINLTAQPMKIFKSKASAVKYLKESDFSSDIIVLEEDVDNPECKDIEYIAAKEPHSCTRLFENVEYSFKFKKLFLDKGIASYNDESRNILIFLSNKHGRLHVNYSNEWSSEFYDNDNDVKHQYQELEKKINLKSDYEEFFKESLIDYAKNVPEEYLRMTKSLRNIKHIVESASRNFELYKHNFSFSDFKKELNEDKEKYLKDYQSNLSDFLSKIASMPIQFGVYIHLMVRFSEELLPIVATTIIILSWSIFKVITVNRILENVKEFKENFQKDLDILVEKSGIDESEVKTVRCQVSQKFDKSIKLINIYKIFVVIFSISVLFICMLFIYRLLMQELATIMEQNLC